MGRKKNTLEATPRAGETASQQLAACFQNLANSIRSKGVTGTMTPSEMVDKIKSIQIMSKWGVGVDAVIGDVDANGVLQAPSGSCALYSEDIRQIPENGWRGKMMGRSTVTSVILPNLTSIGNNGMKSCFNGNTALTRVELPNLTTLGDLALEKAFNYCDNLTVVKMPRIQTMSSNAISQMCDGTFLTLLDFSEAGASFAITAPAAGQITHGNLKIVVPDALVSAFKSSATSSYQPYIIGKSDYTGEL